VTVCDSAAEKKKECAFAMVGFGTELFVHVFVCVCLFP